MSARRRADARKPAPSAGSPSRPAGRCRARFSRVLPALAILLGALSLFAAAPAQAQTTVWSATLTVQDLGTGSRGCWTSGTIACSLTTVLTDDDFTYNQVDYEIRLIQLRTTGSLAGVFLIQLNKAIPSDLKSALTLHVGSKQFPLADASLSGSDSQAYWDDADLTLTVGATVAVSLRPASSTDADLSALTARTSTSETGAYSSLALSPAFDAATTAYTATVGDSVTHLRLRATVEDTGKATVKLGPQGATTSIDSGMESAPMALTMGSNLFDVIVAAEDTTTTKTYTITVTVVPEVSISASPNPVLEGGIVSVMVTLSSELSSHVDIPVSVTAGTAEAGDYGRTAPAIRVRAGNLSSTARFIRANQDDDEDDETITVALGFLPSSLTTGSPSSVLVTITDDDRLALSVDATPACGSRVSDLSVAPEWQLALTTVPDAAAATQLRVVASAMGAWQNGLPIETTGRSVSPRRDNTFAQLRRSFPGFTGFEYRLTATPAVTARCTWQFDNGGSTGLRVTDLRVTQGSRRVTLRWNAPANPGGRIAGYDVQYRRSDGGWIDHGDSRSRETTRVIDLGAIPPSDVHVRVRPRFYKPGTGSIARLDDEANWVTWPSTASGMSGTGTQQTQQQSVQESGGSGDSLGEPEGIPDSGVQAAGQEPPADPNAGLIAQMYEWRNDEDWRTHKAHTDRWDRALLAFGESVSDTTLTPMTADEAQWWADRGLERWVQVAEALKALEAGGDSGDGDGGSDPPAQDRQPAPPALHGALLGEMYASREDPNWQHLRSHTDRWDRALLAFGEPVSDTSLTPMTDAQAQAWADGGLERWVPVAAALKSVVTGTRLDDTLTGSDSGELLAGLDGGDRMSGLGGDDELRGGDGSDALTGGAGRDRFVFFSSDTGAKVITDFASGDVVVLKGSGWSSVADIIASVQAVGSLRYRYTLAPGLTVDTSNNRTLRTEDFVEEE